MSNRNVKNGKSCSDAVGFKIAEAVYAAVPDSYTPSSTVVGNSPSEKADSDWLTGAKATDPEEGQEEETV